MIDFVVTEEDPQKQKLYDAELCPEIKNETFNVEVAENVVEGLWKKHVSLPVSPPSLRFESSKNEHVYYAWDHEITFASTKNDIPVANLIHELAHAKLGALGIGPFVETHGPFFTLVFGQMWSTYSAQPYKVWKRRCGNQNLMIASELPDLSEYTWAVVREGGREYAVRPAQRAVEIGWNIVDTFSLNVKDNHPMSNVQT